MPQPKPLLFLIFLAFFFKFNKAPGKLSSMFMYSPHARSKDCVQFATVKSKGRLAIKFNDKVLDLKQFSQQTDSIFSVILRYARSEGILHVHDLVCKIISYNAMATCNSLHIAIR